MTDHPTAPVQDDDAELIERIDQRISDHRAHLAALQAKYGSGVVPDERNAGLVINFGDLLDLRSRLSPTPETGQQQGGVPASPSGCQPSASNLRFSRSGIPNAAEWRYSLGQQPLVSQSVLVWALGRYGDVYGPMPFEMIAPDAWEGNMLHASHDLVAWAECAADFRDVFAYQPRDPSVYGKRATAASAIEARQRTDPEEGLDPKGESAVGNAETPNRGSTPETGLVEAAMRDALPVLEEMAQGRGTRKQIVIVAQTLSKLIRASLSNVLPDEV